MSRDMNCLHPLPTVNTPSTQVLHTQHTLACINKRVQYPKIHPLRTPTLELSTVMHTQRRSHLYRLSPRLARGTSSSNSLQLQTTMHHLRSAAVKSLMMLAQCICAAASSARSVNDGLELAIWRHTTAKLPQNWSEQREIPVFD